MVTGKKLLGRNVMLHYIQISSRSRNELIDITARVEELVRKSGVSSGVCHLCCLHTTAGITVNEGADPDVRHDISRFLETLVPVDAPFDHGEGNSDAHVKSTLVGVSETMIVEGGQLLLGTWQSVYFCEFDGPRSRKVAVKIVAD
jgi:secondary thiamine-phosphate synthase enzyme